VCLHCRRDARIAAGVRRRRIALRGLLLTVAVGGVLTAVGGLAVAVSGTQTAGAVSAAETAVDGLRSHVRDLLDRKEVDSSIVVPASARQAQVEAGRLPSPALLLVAPPAPALPPTPPMLPIVGQGSTRLRDSVVAVRRGDSVTVHFDTPGSRTRRPEKFEQIVRATLPAIYGPMADSVLEHVPAGDLARSDLLTDLPTRGLRLAIGDGWALALWPATRPGLDGPLVVMYRAMVTKLR
jgi:hypothetical protein